MSSDFRREAALQCLLVFLKSPGERESKVKAAVEYANLLVAELDRADQALYEFLLGQRDKRGSNGE